MNQLAAFLAVSAIVIVTPGQDTALTIRNSLLGGRRAGVLTALGVSTGQAVWALATSLGIAALIGHWRPLFMGLGRGGKIVATTGGVALALAPFATLAAAGVWIVTFLVTRYTSVASLLSAATLPLFAILFGASWLVVGFAAGAAVAIFALHRGNIARLLNRTENRFALGRRTT